MHLNMSSTKRRLFIHFILHNGFILWRWGAPEYNYILSHQSRNVKLCTYNLNIKFEESSIAREAQTGETISTELTNSPF